MADVEVPNLVDLPLHKLAEELARLLEKSFLDIKELREAHAEAKTGGDASQAKVEELTLALEGVKAELEKKQESVDDLPSRLQRAEDDLAAMKEKFEASENEKKELIQKLDEYEKVVAENTLQVKTSTADSTKHSQLVDELSEAWKMAQRAWDDTKGKFDQQKLDMAAIQKTVEDVTVAQQRVESTVSRYYETLWKTDILSALEEMKATLNQESGKEVVKRCEELKNESQQLLSHALSMLAKVAADRKRMSARNDILVSWRQQSWIFSQRRQALGVLDRLVKGRQRETLARWTRRATVENRIDELRSQYEAKIPKVDEEVLKMGLVDTTNDLKLRTQKLEEEKAAKTELLSAVDSAKQFTVERFKEVELLDNKLGETNARIVEVKDTVQVNSTNIGTLRQDLTHVGGRLGEVEVQVPEFARVPDVNGVVKDVLLCWNMIKQLDLMKADKKEMEALGLEGASRDALSTQKIGEIERAAHVAASEGVSSVQTELGRVSHKVDATADQFRTLQRTLGSLATFVEDIVAKIAVLQANESQRSGPSIPFRTGGGYRLEGATGTGTGGGRDEDAFAPEHDLEEPAQGALRPRQRPQSAQTRRDRDEHSAGAGPVVTGVGVTSTNSLRSGIGNAAGSGSAAAAAAYIPLGSAGGGGSSAGVRRGLAGLPRRR